MLHRVVISGLLISAVSVWAATPQSVVHQHRAKKKAVAAQPTPVVTPVPPPAPAPPPTPEQMPPTPAQVSYQNGQLSIVANNATLGDILSKVGAATGAKVDIPAGAGAQRMYAQLGPGPARDVVTSLLNGSPNNFIILGSQTTPGGIANIMLTPREGGATASGPPPAGQPVQQQAEEDNEQEAPVQPIPPPQPEAQQQFPPQGQVQAQPGTPTPNNPQTPQIKTPEQLLQELQRMQQQQQQQQRNPRQPQ